MNMDARHLPGDERIAQLVASELRADMGRGDVTSEALVSPGAVASARVVAREEIVVAGGGIGDMLFRALDAAVDVRQLAADGGIAACGDTVLQLAGATRALLAGERTLLNFMQRMCGIATLTRKYVQAVSGWDVEILDTRKTTPGLRVLEKYSVLCGGGSNHRMGLYDMAMIKDNHRVFWEQNGEGGLAGAVERIRRESPGVAVEVEVDSEDELRAALQGAPEWILLDNMSPEQLRRCVELGGGQCRLEASGGITLETIGEVAASGVDAISVGALTHSAVAADLALEFV